MQRVSCEVYNIIHSALDRIDGAPPRRSELGGTAAPWSPWSVTSEEHPPLWVTNHKESCDKPGDVSAAAGIDAPVVHDGYSLNAEFGSAAGSGLQQEPSAANAIDEALGSPIPELPPIPEPPRVPVPSVHLAIAEVMAPTIPVSMSAAPPTIPASMSEAPTLPVSASSPVEAPEIPASASGPVVNLTSLPYCEDTLIDSPGLDAEYVESRK